MCGVCLAPLRFPTLHRQLANEVLTYIRGGAEPAERMIRNLLDCEHDFINCDHPDFIGGRGAIRQVMQERSTRGARGKVSRHTVECHTCTQVCSGQAFFVNCDCCAARMLAGMAANRRLSCPSPMWYSYEL